MAKKTTAAKKRTTQSSKKKKKKVSKRPAASRKTAASAAKKAGATKRKKKAPSSEKAGKASFRLATMLARRSNQAILDEVLGGHFPDETLLSDIGYDTPPRKLALTQQLKARGVPVDAARIAIATTVGEVRREMNRVKPEWNP